MSDTLTRMGAINRISDGDPVRRRVFEAMEITETWTLDTPGSVIDEALIGLGVFVDERRFRIPEDVRTEGVVEMLASVHAGRFFVILRAMLETHPAMVNALIERLEDIERKPVEAMRADENIVRLRLLVADQMNYLAEILADERMNLATYAIEEAYANPY